MFASFNARALGLDLDPIATLELAARHGFGGVDLLVRDLAASGVEPAEYRARLSDLGLRAGAFALPCDWKGDAGRFRTDLAGLPRLAGLAASLGFRRTGTWVRPETGPLGPGDDPAAAADSEFELHAERLAAIARVLADAGVRLGLEVLGPATCRTGLGAPLFDRLAGARLGALLDRLDANVAAGSVGLLADAFHLHAAGEPMAAGWGRGVGRVVWVHVADLPAGASPDRAAIMDRDRGLPGEHGAVDARGLLVGLAGLGYDGPVTPEPMPGCRSLRGLGPEEVARAAGAAMAAVWPAPGTSPTIRP